MTLVIWKYPLKFEVEQFVMLPMNAKILSVQQQFDGIDRSLMLWAMVETEQDVMMERRILLRGTGTVDEIDYSWKHLATIVTESGYVWHIFDGTPTQHMTSVSLSV